MLLSAETGVIFWTLITFVFLLIVLSRVAWRPLLSMLDERETRIREALEQADKAREEARAAVEENKQALARAQATRRTATPKGAWEWTSATMTVTDGLTSW